MNPMGPQEFPFAGGTANLGQFLIVNPGLRSRIPPTIQSPDFDPAEVGKIVVSQLAKKWTFDEAAAAVTAAFAYAALGSQDTSKGRWARIFADLLEAEQIEYVATNGSCGAEMKLIPTEVIEALSLTRSAACSRRCLCGRVPAEGRTQLGGNVGEDLDVVLVLEAERKRERHFIDLLESRVCVELLSDLIAGADEIGRKQHPARPLGSEGPGSALIDVSLVLLPLFR